MPRFYAKIEVLVDAENRNQAMHAMSGLLTECGKWEGAIVTWQYLVSTKDNEAVWLVEVPSSLDFPE